MDDQEKIYIESEDDGFYEKPNLKKLLRVLVFMLGKESYCVDIRQIKEVVKMPETTRVPNVPSFVLGAANFRGEIISVLDMHYFFGVEPQGKPRDVRVLVTDIAGGPVGFWVDCVKDTVEIDEDEVQSPLATLKGNLAISTRGQVAYGEDILVFLDLEKILLCDEMRHLRKGE